MAFIEQAPISGKQQSPLRGRDPEKITASRPLIEIDVESQQSQVFCKFSKIIIADEFHILNLS